MPQINLLSIQFIINPSNNTNSVMQHPTSPFFQEDPEQNYYPILDNSRNFTHFPPTHQPHPYVELNFQQVFGGKLAPNSSSLSASTFSEGSVDHFCFQDEIYGQSQAYNNDFLPHNSCFFGDITEKCEEKIDSLSPDKQPLYNVLHSGEEEEGKAKQGESSHDETKNIPKNYIKAIFTFILENSQFIDKLYREVELASKTQDLMQFIKSEKKVKKYTIQRLKSLWLNQVHGKAMRIVSGHFLRRRSLAYIFGSKIQRKMSHIRHRYKFIEAIERPKDFTNIK